MDDTKTLTLIKHLRTLKKESLKDKKEDDNKKSTAVGCCDYLIEFLGGKV